MVGMEFEKSMGTHARNLTLLALLTALAFVAVLALASDDAEAQETKDITFYFHNVTTSKPIGNVATLRTMDTNQGTDPLSTTTPTVNSVKTDFYLYPALANDTTIAEEITVYMWAIRTVRMGDADQATLIWELFNVDETGAKVARISRGLRTLSMIIDWRQYYVTNSTVNRYTVPEGHYLLLEFELQGSSSNYYQIGWGDGSYRSSIVVGCRDYVRVEDARVLDHTGTPQHSLDYDAPVKDVTFHADVTDPFGGYDIRPVNATLEGPSGSTILDDPAMAKVSGYFTSWRSGFELAWNYDGYPAGMYTLTVSAVDNSGWYFRFPAHPENETYGGHQETLAIVFWIGGPPEPVTVEVRDNLTRPLEGATVVIDDGANDTDSNGVTVVMVSNGTFPVSVLWQDVQVYAGEVTVDGPTSVHLEVAVYRPSFLVVDDSGDPVEDAVALVEHPNGTVLASFPRTDASGAFSLERVPAGDAGITILWLGATVHEGRLTIDGNGPFTLECWVHTLDIRVEDDMGTGLELAQVVVRDSTTHLVMDSRLTDQEGNMTTRLPRGSYDISVIWRGSTVHDDTRDLLVNASGGITLLASIYRVELVVSDSSGLPLADAKVVVGTVETSAVLDYGVTDAEGVASTRLAPGNCSITVYWRDVIVGAIADLPVEEHGQVPITADVHWVTFTVVDAQDEALPAAGLALVHSSGGSFGTRLTDVNGTATFRLPNGGYRAGVTWLGVTVLDTGVTVDSAEPKVLVALVYAVTLRVTDTLDLPLEGALVTTVVVASGQGAGGGTTDALGEVTARLPAGTVAIHVSWLDSSVFDGHEGVVEACVVTLVASVHTVTFRALDSADVGLGSALISLVNVDTERSFGAALADVEGEAAFRLPAGVYTMSVVWRDQQVFEGEVQVSSNGPIDLACSVHYVVVALVDSASEPLEGALVTVTDGSDGPTLGSLTSDEGGLATFRLPDGTYALQAVWSGVTVLDGELVVDADGTQVRAAEVFYAELRLTDSRDVPLEGAHVTVLLPVTEVVTATGTTSPEGCVTLRLAKATYGIVALWKDETVLETTVDVTTDGPVELVAWVHYLGFHAADGEDVDLPDATLTVTSGATGAVLGSGVTDGAGECELRLPRGTFSLRVSWMSIIVHSDDALDVTGDADLRLNTTVHCLTVSVRGADGSGVEKAVIDVRMDGSVLATGSTASDGTIAFRLPAGTYVVNMTLRTTDRMSHIDVGRSKEVGLDDSMTVIFDLSSFEYPLPVYKTYLFFVLLAIALLVLLLVLLLWRSLSGSREGHDEGIGTSPVPGDGLEVDLVEAGDKVSLTDRMDEAEIDLDD